MQVISEHISTCCYCGVGCGIKVSKHHDGHITVKGDDTHPASKGMLCSKGSTLHYTVNDRSDRLLYPEMRMHKSKPRMRVSWDEALTRTAAVFKTLIDKYGPDSVAFYASGQCLTEEYYVINKLVKGFLGTNNLDTNSRLCMSSAVVGYKLSLGEDSVPVSYDDIELCDLIYVTGANPAWCHPILWRRVEQAKEKNPDLKIIVCDPRKTQSCELADLHLQIIPGTDVILNHAIGRALIEHGNIDIQFIRDHADGYEEYKKSVFGRSLDEAAALCGINLSELLKAATMIARAKGFLSMWTMGLNQSVIGVNKNLSLINLHLITGHIGKPGSGPFSLTGQPNAMGGREVGGLSNLLPAHRDLTKESDRNEVEKFWQIPLGTIRPKAGLTATEMFDALHDGRLKAIWIICTNPLISIPDVRRAEEGLKKAKFVVVQDISNKLETLAYADVILPAAAWTEKEGTMTSAGRYITYLEKINDPPGEAIPDAEIICRFARKMNFEGFQYSSFDKIFEEHAALTAGTNIDISGLNYSILKNKRTVQWPYLTSLSQVDPDYTGTKRLFTNRVFYTDNFRAKIHAVPDENLSESISPEFPFILTTGRIRDQWHTRSKTGKVNKLNQHIAHSFLEIHPRDAAERNIKEGNIVSVFNHRGQVKVKAKITADIRQGVVFLPMHWGKIFNHDSNRANNLTANIIDQRSKEPDFKYAAVAVENYRKEKQKIIIVGAGAGAFGFIKEFRRLNDTDEIVVFSNEPYSFYNRVLLPDYISGHMKWDQLMKMDLHEEKKYNITLHRNLGIQSIDLASKKIRDARDGDHGYDLLILATGSRAAVLKDFPGFEGVFTMRSRWDADRFIEYTESKKNVVIVGGGLLGIELAAALIEKGIKVSIIQRIGRLMDRQLDPTGSQMLDRILSMRGIDIFYNDEIERMLGQKKLDGIKLKSGISIECDALVMAIGTVPNVELAKNAGIECKRGVVINEYMQSNIPDVYAIGELAEYKGTLFGITAAAEEQAEKLANYLNGDMASYYKGSLLMNILKVQGADVCSLGEVEIPNDPIGYEEIIFIDKAQHYYKKCIVYQDKLVGAILIGDKAEFLEFKNLIANKIELSDKRLQLLRSGKAPEPVMGTLICSCNQVGSGNIEQRIEAGCKDIVQLCQLTGAGTGCGSCRSEVNKILELKLAISHSIDQESLQVQLTE